MSGGTDRNAEGDQILSDTLTRDMLIILYTRHGHLNEKFSDLADRVEKVAKRVMQTYDYRYITEVDSALTATIYASRKRVRLTLWNDRFRIQGVEYAMFKKDAPATLVAQWRDRFENGPQLLLSDIVGGMPGYPITSMGGGQWDVTFVFENPKLPWAQVRAEVEAVIGGDRHHA